MKNIDLYLYYYNERIEQRLTIISILKNKNYDFEEEEEPENIL
jgi:hypothetical protein